MRLGCRSIFYGRVRLDRSPFGSCHLQLRLVGRGRQERNCDKDKAEEEVKPTQRKQSKLWKELQRSIHSDVDFVVVEEGREDGREEERKPYIVEPSVGKKFNCEGGCCRVEFPYGWGEGKAEVVWTNSVCGRMESG